MTGVKLSGMFFLMFICALLPAWTIVEHPADEKAILEWNLQDEEEGKAGVETLEIRNSGGDFRFVFLSSGTSSSLELQLFGPDGYFQDYSLTEWLFLSPGEYAHRKSFPALIQLKLSIWNTCLNVRRINRAMKFREWESFEGPDEPVNYIKIWSFDVEQKERFQSMKRDYPAKARYIRTPLSRLSPELLQELPLPPEEKWRLEEVKTPKLQAVQESDAEVRVFVDDCATIHLQELGANKIIGTLMIESGKGVLCFDRILCTPDFTLTHIRRWPREAGKVWLREIRVGYWKQPARYEIFIAETDAGTGKKIEYGYICPVGDFLAVDAMLFE